MKRVSAQLPPEPTEVFFSTADRLRAEGKIEGFKINELLKTIEISLNLMHKYPDLSVEEIANLTSSQISLIKKIKTGFEKGSEKKARKVVFGLFDKFGDLDLAVVERLQKSLKKYVSIFGK